MHVSRVGCGLPAGAEKFRQLGIKWQKFCTKMAIPSDISAEAKIGPTLQPVKIGQNDRKMVHLATLILGKIMALGREGYWRMTALPCK